MNRRSFLSSMLKVGVAAAFLPAASTYVRHWKPVRHLVITNPDWINAQYELQFLTHDTFRYGFDPFPLRFNLDESTGLFVCEKMSEIQLITLST